MIEWLNDNSGAIIGIATAALVLVTMVYVGITGSMARGSTKTIEKLDKLADALEDSAESQRLLVQVSEKGLNLSEKQQHELKLDRKKMELKAGHRMKNKSALTDFLHEDQDFSKEDRLMLATYFLRDLDGQNPENVEMLLNEYRVDELLS